MEAFAKMALSLSAQKFSSEGSENGWCPKNEEFKDGVEIRPYQYGPELDKKYSFAQKI